MNVTMLSDITRPDGRSIEKWAYEGSYPAHTTMDYPRRPRPAPGSIMEDLEACNLLNIFDQGQNQRLLPTEYPTDKEVLGTYKLPDDNGNAILQQLQSKTGTKSWTDGTVKDGKGAHAYTIRPQAPNTPGLSIEGKSMTPGNPRTISSLQPEHYVSNSTITTLKSNKHHLPKSSDPEGNIEY